MLVFSGIAFQTFRTTPIYEGRTTVLIEVADPKVVTFSQVLDQGGGVTNEFYQTQYELLKSRTLARQTVETLNLWRHPALGGGAPNQSGPSQSSREPSVVRQALARTRSIVAWVRSSPGRIMSSAGRLLGSQPQTAPPSPVNPLEQATAMLQHGLAVEPKRNSRIVEVRFQSTDPALAAQVPNALARNYINLTMNFRLQTAKDASRWLEQQLAEQRRAVEASEEALQRYREKNNALSLGDKQNSVVAQKLTDLNVAVSRAREARIDKQALYEQARSIEDNPEALDALPPVLANPLVQRIKSELADLQRKQAQLSQPLGERHPDMVVLKATILATQAKLRNETSKIVQSVRTDYLTAQARESSLLADLRAQEDQAMALDRKAIEFGVLERDAESTRQLFQSLLQRAKEMDVSSELKTTNIRIVDEAVVPRGPISPKTSRSVGLGFFAATALALALAFALDYFDHRIKSPDEILLRLGVPFLALVPKFSGKLVKGRVPVFGGASPPGMLDAFSDLRASVLLSTVDDPSRSWSPARAPAKARPWLRPIWPSRSRTPRGASS